MEPVECSGQIPHKIFVHSVISLTDGIVHQKGQTKINNERGSNTSSMYPSGRTKLKFSR